MTRSILYSLLASLSIGAVAALPIACTNGGVGDPCTPGPELNAEFEGFLVPEAYIQTGDSQCPTNICLVNHFQGRVSCPAGQAAPQQCKGASDTSCPAGKSCVLSEMNSYVCHAPGACQTSADTPMSGAGKDCCIPGTDTPVAVAVCGQCAAASQRNASEAVYCSCRCCAPCCPNGALPPGDDPSNPSCSLDQSTCGPACDPNFNYCSCPSGYSCVDLRFFPTNGAAAGAYCIKSGTAFQSTSTAMCGAGAAGGYVGGDSCSP